MEVHEGAGPGDGVLDLSRLNLNTLSLDTISEERKRETKQLYLSSNRLASLPGSICLFSNLEFLDISNNGLSSICEDITRLSKLKALIAKNNRLDEFSLPKEFGSMQLEVLNLSGNRFEEIPPQFMKLQRLQSLSLGGNRLKSVPAEIENLTRYAKEKRLPIYFVFSRDFAPGWWHDLQDVPITKTNKINASLVEFIFLFCIVVIIFFLRRHFNSK